MQTNQYLKILYITRVGVTGNVLINKDADRVRSSNVWNYAEGHDSYYASMLVDLTLPPEDVGNVLRKMHSKGNLHTIPK